MLRDSDCTLRVRELLRKLFRTSPIKRKQLILNLVAGSFQSSSGDTHRMGQISSNQYILINFTFSPTPVRSRVRTHVSGSSRIGINSTRD